MDSLTKQVSGSTRLAAAHRTWFVADVFFDVASANTDATKLEFNKMISECEKGIPTKSLSRFGHDAKEVLEAIRKIRSTGQRTIFEKNKIYTETVKDKSLISIIEVCEQAVNEWRSENIRLDLKYRDEDDISGFYNRVLYEYKKKIRIEYLLLLKKKQKLLGMFLTDIEGYSIGGITDKLENKKIKTFKGKERLNPC